MQLDNGTDVMLYQMRRTDGSVCTDCTGTIVDGQGNTTAIAMPAYRIEATDHWTSPRTQARYPAAWTVTLPDVPDTFTITPTMSDQEMVMEDSDIVYWEGACTVTGSWARADVTGKAYVELTGYVEPVARRF